MSVSVSLSLPRCSACQVDSPTDSSFCYQCGRRIRSGPWDPVSPPLYFVLLHLLALLGAFSFLMCLTGWGILVGVPLAWQGYRLSFRLGRSLKPS